MSRLPHLIAWVIAWVLGMPVAGMSADLCWYHVEGVDYRLSLIDVDSGEEVLDGSILVTDLRVESWGPSVNVVRYPVPSRIADRMPSESQFEIWVITAQQMIDGELAVSVPTVIDALRCTPPYVVHPPRIKADYTCDGKVTVSDSLKHLSSEVVLLHDSCEN